MKKKLFSLLLALLLLASTLPTGVLAADDANTINVYNWGQYISEGDDGSIDVIAEFEAATGIKVNYVTFDSNETMYTITRRQYCMIEIESNKQAWGKISEEHYHHFKALLSDDCLLYTSMYLFSFAISSR